MIPTQGQDSQVISAQKDTQDESSITMGGFLSLRSNKNNAMEAYKKHEIVKGVKPNQDSNQKHLRKSTYDNYQPFLFGKKE
mmetsp:Transcript_26451/g.25595  ORF Transcript_26451/g.25595 Transcript_26451/m.25595 type:complete len:81 (+) Transcript_26451:1636-1878(+)